MRELICHPHCRYHKPGKIENPGCGGLEFLLTRPELAAPLADLAPSGKDSLYGLAEDDARLQAICNSCEFRVDGCDFRDPQVPRADCSPCGGLIAVAGLLAAGLQLDLS